MHAEERAAQVWAALALAAHNRQVLTYDIVAKLTGVPRQGLAKILGHIHEYCRQNRKPPLTILVVNSETGVPGDGFTAARDIPEAQMRVFSHDWLTPGPPTPDQLAEAWSRASS